VDQEDHISFAMSTVPVSVVVPCFRCASTIRRAVHSVTAQTLQPEEILLVDDASGDDTLRILRELQRELGEERVRVIALAVNGGAGEARNAGWDAARGEYVAFLDADDTWHPRKLEIQYAFMRARPEFGLTGHAHARSPQEASNIADDAKLQPSGFRRISRRALLMSNRFITPSVMVRRELPYRFEHGQRHMEDHALWLTMIFAGVSIARLDATLATIHKAPFGEAGLSAAMLRMEAAELRNYRRLHRRHMILLPTFLLLCGYSLVKFVRRLLLQTFGLH